MTLQKPIKALTLPIAALLLAGCAGPSPYIAPVEERSLVPVTPPPAGTVMPVEQSATVSVSPIYDAPSFTPAATAQPTPVPTQPAAEQAMPKVEQGSNTAVVALLGDARQAANRRDYSGAESQIERALRISPRDPQIYLQLAALKRQKGEYLQAEQVALRGIALAAGLPDYKRKLWRELALIRTQAGDFAGATQAEAEADRL